MTTFEIMQAWCAKCGKACTCDTYEEVKGMVEDMLSGHDCHLSPEDSCACEEVYSRLNIN